MSSSERPAGARARRDRLATQARGDLPLVRPPSPVAGRTVLVISSTYAPDAAGAAPYTTGLAEHLAASASRVDVVTGSARGWRARRSGTGADGVPRVHRLRRRTADASTGETGGWHEFRFLMRARRARLPEAPDLVVAVTPGVGAVAAGAKLARRHRVPLVCVVQGLTGTAGDAEQRPQGLAGRMERVALSEADVVAILSEAFRDGVRACGVPDGRIHLVPGWTHISAVPTPQRDARLKLGWQLGGFAVVHTGTMGPTQDLGNVVEAARLLEERDDITFYLVGNGPRRTMLREQARGLPNVQFVEPLTPQDHALALSAADVLLVNERPTAGEMSLPSKLTSYLSAGRPVLAAAWPGGVTGRELDKAAGAATRVDPGYPLKLASAVQALAAEPDRRARMGATARAYAEARLGRDRSMAALDAVLASILRED